MIDVDTDMGRRHRDRVAHPVRMHRRHREPLAWLVFSTAAAVALSAAALHVFSHMCRVAL